MTVRYETKTDKEIEMRLGNNYVLLLKNAVYVKPSGDMASFDFKVYDTAINEQVAWLEVKKKSGFFLKNEFIPRAKWEFFLASPITCLFLVERANKAYLFDLQEIHDSGRFWEGDIVREDHITGRTDVIKFPLNAGQLVYYV